MPAPIATNAAALAAAVMRRARLAGGGRHLRVVRGLSSMAHTMGAECKGSRNLV